jgi:hypothetical protein
LPLHRILCFQNLYKPLKGRIQLFLSSFNGVQGRILLQAEGQKRYLSYRFTVFRLCGNPLPAILPVYVVQPKLKAVLQPGTKNKTELKTYNL